jgi:hypothetical protein
MHRHGASVLGALAAVVLVGCGLPSPSPTGGPSFPGSLAFYLDDFAQGVTITAPQPGAIAPDVALQRLRERGSGNLPPAGVAHDPPIYAVFSCVRVDRCGSGLFAVATGDEHIAAWIIVWPHAHDGNGDPSWLIVDAITGERYMGLGPG